MAFLDEVKERLRITHNKLNNDLNRQISAARRELIRIGVDDSLAASESDPLITEAIKTYVQFKNAADEKEAEGYWNSWVVQADALRKSADYRRDGYV